MSRSESLWQDIRFGLRMLRKNFGFTLIAVLTLATGIGANTALFTVINAVLFRPLPYPQSDQIVQVWTLARLTGARYRPSLPDFADIKAECRSFSHLAHYRMATYHFTGTSEPAEVAAGRASVEFFQVLNVKPILGRTFLPEEGVPGRDQVTVLSYNLWRNRYDGDTHILGRAIGLEGKSYVVCGVMPAEFSFPATAELWVPYSSRSENVHIKRDDHFDFGIARLRSGVSLSQAQAEMTLISQRLEEQHRATNEGKGALLVPLKQELVGDFKPALLMLLGGVGAVLLIACANTANLQLTRGLARQKELAIRTALGAGRGRIIRQLLVESVMLSLVAGVAGLLLAYSSIGALIALAPANVPRIHETQVDGVILLACLLISLVTGILSGLLPALQASRVDITDRLKEGGGTTDGKRRHLLRNTLVVAQISLAVILLVSAALFLKSFDKLNRVSRGFDSESVVTARITLPWSYRASGKHKQFFRQLLERVAQNPGSRQLALASSLPMGPKKPAQVWFKRAGEATVPGQERTAGFNYVSPAYFDVLRIPLQRGQTLSHTDTTNSPRVVVVDQSLASRYFPDADPLGQRIQIEGQGTEPFTIVGIAGGIRNRDLAETPTPQLYLHYQQINEGSMWFLARGGLNVNEFQKAVSREMQTLDQDQSMSAAKTLDEYIALTSGLARFRTFLLTLVAVLAFTLSVVGTYSVIAYSTTQRTREIGLRLALGAQRHNILRLIVGQGAKLALVGMVVGIAAALALTRLVREMLFEVAPHDPLSFTVIPLLILVAVLLASLLPALRATRLDPLTALRQ
jgi:putative ABC transport system permease protein